MISAKLAREHCLENGRGHAIEECKKWTEDSITRAVKAGRNRTCLSNTYYIDKNGNNYDCESEIKDWLRGLGYHFEPTGYVGGVWQLSEDICW